MFRAHPVCLFSYAMQAILDSSSSPYAQLLATSSLIKIVTEHSMATQVHGWLLAVLGVWPVLGLHAMPGGCDRAQHGGAGAADDFG